MVRVRQQHLDAEVLKLFWQDSLHRRLRADRHKDGCVDRAMPSDQTSDSGSGRLVTLESLETKSMWKGHRSAVQSPCSFSAFSANLARISVSDVTPKFFTSSRLSGVWRISSPI